MLWSLTRIGLLATLVGGSTIALVGSDRARVYYETGKEAIVSAIDEAQGLEAKLKLIRTQIRSLDKEQRRIKEEAIESTVELEALRHDVASRRVALEKQAALLEKVSAMLGSGEARYVIAGRGYSREEVERDAAEKLALFDVQKDTLANLDETLATKEKAQQMASENVSRAEALRSDLRAQVSLLEARLEKYRAKQDFAATVEDVVDTAEIDSALARARERIAEFSKQLEVKDRMLDERLKRSATQPAKGIEYEVSEGSATDLASRIRQSLAARGVARGEPAPESPSLAAR